MFLLPSTPMSYVASLTDHFPRLYKEVVSSGQGLIYYHARPTAG